VEVDGDYHDDEGQRKIDEFRTVTLQKNGYTLSGLLMKKY
jgi:very-short-patch-repair endonuclease